MQFFREKIIKDGAKPSRIVIAVIYTAVIVGLLVWGFFAEKPKFEEYKNVNSSQISNE